MKQFCLMLFLFIYLPNKTIGQVLPFQISYGEKRNDLGSSIISLNENGYLIFGTTSNFSSNRTDLILTRINSSGNIIWMNKYGGYLEETAEHIEPTADGGYILLASTTSFGAGNSDLLIIKTTANGDIKWSKTFGGPQNDFSACIKELSDEGYIIVGRTQSFGSGGDDAYVIRINRLGDVLWSRTYGTINNERFYYVDNCDNGDFLMTGIENTSDFSKYDVLVMRINSSGDIIFNNSFGDNGGRANDAADCIRSTPDGGYAFSGHYQSFGAGGLDLAITKINNRGNFEWARAFGNTGDERAWDFQIDESNNYMLVGYTTSYGKGNNDALAIRVNPRGETIWTRTYGGSANDEFYECTINNDSIAFIGYTESIGAGEQDIYIVKTDFNGISPEGCTNGRSLIKSSPISPIKRTVNQTVTNLNHTTITNVNLRKVAIVINTIVETNQCPGTTPVTLLDFSSYRENNILHLNWQTSSEYNTKYFIIEQSIDGINFDSIGFINAQNKGDNYQKYLYTIPSFNYSSNYYRLKVSDFDGHSDYSNIIYCHNENKSFNLYPSIFKNTFHIEAPIKFNSGFNVEIIHINGTIYHKCIYTNKEKVELDTTEWIKGIFIVRITSIDGKDQLIQKITKE